MAFAVEKGVPVSDTRYDNNTNQLSKTKENMFAPPPRKQVTRQVATTSPQRVYSLSLYRNGIVYAMFSEGKYNE